MVLARLAAEWRHADLPYRVGLQMLSHAQADVAAAAEGGAELTSRLPASEHSSIFAFGDWRYNRGDSRAEDAGGGRIGGVNDI